MKLTEGCGNKEPIDVDSEEKLDIEIIAKRLSEDRAIFLKDAKEKYNKIVAAIWEESLKYVKQEIDNSEKEFTEDEVEHYAYRVFQMMLAKITGGCRG